MSLLRTLPAILAAGVALAACSGEGPTAIEIPLAEVEITGRCPDVTVGHSCPMSARGITEDGQVVTNAVLRWSSSSPDIASVNPDGRVFGISPGKATILVEAALGQGAASTEIFVRLQFEK